MKIKEKENLQFRILYFFGIIFVVANHCGNGGVSLFYDWFAAYSFHLAIFAFASGYFFVANKGKTYSKIIKRKIKNIIIPLYAWNFVYGIISVFLLGRGFEFFGEMNFENLFLSPIYSGHQFILNLGSWFLIPLFMLEMVGLLFLPLLKKNKNFSIAIFIISLILGMLGIHLAMAGYNVKWWLVLIRFLYFLPFFVLGIFYREILEKFDTLKSSIYFPIVMFLTLCVIYLNGGVVFATPSWCNDFKDIFTPFITGFLGIAFWLRISRELVPVLKNNKIVNLIGKNTFAIMMHHLFGFFILNWIWSLLAKTFTFIDGFNFDAFHSTIWYKYLPKNLSQFQIIYVVVGILFSLLISWLGKKIWNILKNIKEIDSVKRCFNVFNRKYKV